MKPQPHFLIALFAALTFGAHTARALVNGTDDFSQPAVGAILVHEPGSPRGDWVAHCSGFLIHPRVMITAGHCVQGIQANLDDGVYLDARVSFAHNPFDPATFVDGDPDASGWLRIDEIVNNPDNPDWLDIPAIIDAWGTWHDQGALILARPVWHIRPLRVPRFPGQVEFVMRIRCELLPHIPQLCKLHLFGYGLHDFPPSFVPNRRQSAVTSYVGIDPLFVATQGMPADACLGDSGGAVIVPRRRGRDLVVALISSPADPMAPFCTGGTIQYRLDTVSSLKFMRDVVLRANRRGHH